MAIGGALGAAESATIGLIKGNSKSEILTDTINGAAWGACSNYLGGGTATSKSTYKAFSSALDVAENGYRQMLREAARESADAFKPVARKLIVGETLETTGYNLTNAYANEAIKYTFKLKDAF